MKLTTEQKRKRRHRRVRGRVHGSAGRPRLCVFRSSKGIYVQVIDDDAGVTLASASTLQLAGASGSKSEKAAEVGKLVAQRAREPGVRS